MTMTTCNPTVRAIKNQRPSAFRLIVLAIAAHKQRRALTKLDADALNDLGLSHADVKSEASRPFWDVPAAWLR